MKRGFTLVELLSVIIILGLVGLIAIPSITRLLSDSKDKLYNKQVEVIVNATREWGVENVDRISSTKKTYISIRNLITDGYIEQNTIKDPRSTKEDLNGCVVIEYNKPYDKYEYNYVDSPCKSINTIYDLTSSDPEYVCYSFDESTGTILSYDKENPTCSMEVSIPSKIDGVDVKYIGNAAFVTGATKWCYNGTTYAEVNLQYNCTNDYYYEWEDQNKYIESVEFPEGLVGINEWAFADNLISDLDLSDLINLQNIKWGAFYSNEISNIDIDGLTNLSYIGGEVFENNFITKLVIKDLPKLEEIGWDSFKNNQLNILILENLPSLIHIGGRAFEDNQLTSVTIPASVETIDGYAFAGNAFISVTIKGTDIYRFNSAWMFIGFPFNLMPIHEIVAQITTISTGIPNNFTYVNYTYYVVTIPTTGNYQVEVWGAQGGGTTGGNGGYSVGNISLTAGQKIYIYVGGKGDSTTMNSFGGFNGGGISGYSSAPATSGGGGGATDIRIGGRTLANRMIVAGGGGGGTSEDSTVGGIGGGTTGGAGNTSYGGTAGTQIAGGFSGGTGITGGTVGSLGQGGHGGNATGDTSDSGGAGGGGGYYGGGGGSGCDDYATMGSGGGGSGYIGGVTSGQTIAGNATMPNPSGGTMTGRTGNGYARITYLGV